MLKCNGNIEGLAVYKENPLLGNWINKYPRSGYNDTIFTIYSFDKSRFQQTEYETFQSQEPETTCWGGRYKTLKPGLMVLFREYYWHKADSVLFTSIRGDTTIYQIIENKLILYTHGRRFKQLSGQINQLSQGSFYDYTDFRFPYTHELYHFTEDTLHYYNTRSDLPLFPGVWHGQTKYAYSQSEYCIDLFTGFEIIKKGYMFYNGDLIIAQSPWKFKKLKQK